MWNNGVDVNKHIIKLKNDDSITCKDNMELSPYPAPLPNNFAVLTKPGVNRYVMRGCFKAPKNQNTPLWTNYEETEICDDYDGTYCGGSSIRRERCKNDAPGGLADFTHPMPAKGEEYLKNGFIMDRMECSLNMGEITQRKLVSGCGSLGKTPINYTCYKDKNFRSCDRLIGDSQCCIQNSNWRCVTEGYTIENPFRVEGKKNVSGDNCGDFRFRNSDFPSYVPSEVWDARMDRNPFDTGTALDKMSECYDWYNPTLEELPQDKKDKNNCTQYLLKWAKSCKWCKDNGLMGSNDPFTICDEPINGCNTPRTCSGRCTDTLFSNKKTCSMYIDSECNICDSPLWDYIPGGWEALVDPNHPKHNMAKFAYVPKLIKTNKLQPTSRIGGDGKPWLSRDEGDNKNNINNSKGVTTFSDLYPSFYYPNNTSKNLFLKGSLSVSDYTWTNNKDINYKGKSDNSTINPMCKESGNEITPDNQNVWTKSFLEGVVDNALNISRIEKEKEIQKRNDPSRAHTICERNPNLTGYGECDEEVYHYAKLWLEGKWDMTKYTGEGIVDEGVSQGELDRRKKEAMKSCLGLDGDSRPGFACPKSKACRELFKSLDPKNFGEDYPENYTLDQGGETNYLKAYCELMKDDPEMETHCRKLMYNWCAEPVENGEIKYPLKVFHKNCRDWCGRERLSESLPDQKGVCDMLYGKACQQLQADGWIKPNNWNLSPLKEFGYDPGVLKKSCGCFLMGSECGQDNCSLMYCGAGTGGGKGPGPVSYENVNWDYTSPINKQFTKMEEVYGFQGGSTPQWESNIDGNTFECTSENLDSNRCFKNCNYVNTYDTCWLASPEERKHVEGFQNVEGFESVWECEKTNNGDSCQTYNNNYGCFGYCSIDNYNTDGKLEGQCGTDEWFNHRMDLNPAESEYKFKKESNFQGEPNSSRNWPKWQNYYAKYKQQPSLSSNDTINVPGWGSFNTTPNGKPANFSQNEDQTCFYPACGSKDSLKPYRNLLGGNKCSANCSVSIQNTINNQGKIVGGVVSSLNACNSCNSSDQWDTTKLDSRNNNDYITLMGSNDCSVEYQNILNENIDCSLCDANSINKECGPCKELSNCNYGSEMCIDYKTGDNCNVCAENTCCLDPDVNNGSKDLIQKTSNHVSYVCGKTCPQGSKNLAELEGECGTKCEDRVESECGECQYCTWNGEKCVPQCPLPPPNGWGAPVAEVVETYPPLTPIPEDDEVVEKTDELIYYVFFIWEFFLVLFLFVSVLV